jgi:hypothetical protein
MPAVTFRRVCSAAAAAIASVFGLDECLLLLGLGLVTAALWPLVAQVALLAPGLVFVWIALPARAAFVAKSPTHEKALQRRRDR